MIYIFNALFAFILLMIHSELFFKQENILFHLKFNFVFQLDINLKLLCDVYNI